MNDWQRDTSVFVSLSFTDTVRPLSLQTIMNGIQATSSPSSSPSLTPDAGTPSAGRKRQRSQSMESAASSSSPKRSASEGPQAQDRDVSNLSLQERPAAEIDAYMATQDDDPPLDRTIDLSATPPHSRSTQVPPAPLMHPTPQARLAAIEEAKNRPLVVGETWYLVSRAWYRRWHKAVSGVADKEGPVDESDLGPVDNSSLVNSQGNLSVSAVGGIDVEYVPQDAWDLLVSWYVSSVFFVSSALLLKFLVVHIQVWPAHTRPGPQSHSPWHCSRTCNRAISSSFPRVSPLR